MKWIPLESTEGEFDVEIPDKMVSWAQRNNLQVRGLSLHSNWSRESQSKFSLSGHTLLWAKTKNNPTWTHSLYGEAFTSAVFRHLEQTLQHFDGLGVNKWDVINEMVDQGLDNHTFYLDHSGDPGIRVEIYKHVRETFPGTTLFVSDYGIVADKYDRFGRTQIIFRYQIHISES